MSSSNDVDPVREVRRMHVLLEDWFGGIRQDLDPLKDSLAPDFTAVGPDGTRRNGTEMLEALADERDAFSSPVRVNLQDVTKHRDLYGVHHLTFEKHLAAGEETEVRTCSVWLRETNRAPTGLQWLHLQETPVEAEPEEEPEA